VRELQLAAQPLLPKIALDESSILDRRADLIGDGCDQFAVAAVKASSPSCPSD